MADSGEGEAAQRNTWSRTIACEDLAERARSVELFISEKGYLALRVPPGEVAVLKPDKILELRHAIEDGQVEVMARWYR